MKKLIFIIIFILVLSVGYSQSIEYTNQVTVEWDKVLPIEPTDIINYQVWIDSAMTGQQKVDETELLQYTITFVEEGEYIIGVSAKRIIAPSPEFPAGDIFYTGINWSNVNGVSTPNPFVVRRIDPIQSPEGLRLQ